MLKSYDYGKVKPFKIVFTWQCKIWRGTHSNNVPLLQHENDLLLLPRTSEDLFHPHELLYLLAMDDLLGMLQSHLHQMNFMAIDSYLAVF